MKFISTFPQKILTMGLEVSKIFSPKPTKDEISDNCKGIEFPSIRQLQVDNAKSRLTRCKATLTEEYYLLNGQLKSSLLDSTDIKKAKILFNGLKQLSVPVNIIGNAIEVLESDENHTPLFWLSSELIKECYKQQTLIDTETIHYGIGNRCCNVYTVDKAITVELELSEITRAKADIGAIGDILTQASENGSIFTCYFHTHPGQGKKATHNSPIDIDYQSNLERGGYKTIGCIFSRDGYLRFFSDKLDFQVMITGKGVEHVKGNIYKIK